MSTASTRPIEYGCAAPQGRFASARRLGYGQVLLFSFLAALASSVGQTFFISLFVPSMEGDLAMNAAGVGTIYGLATFAGAFVLPWFGRWFDRTDLLRFAATTAAILVMGSFLFATANRPVQLFLAFALLRLGGPGLLSHIASAGPGRYFVRARGAALSLAALGFTAGEGILPIITVHVIAAAGWRLTFAIAGAPAGLVTIPAASRLVRGRRRFRRVGATKKNSVQSVELRTFGRAIWPLVFVLVGPSALETGLIFHQDRIAHAQGLPFSVFAAGFIVYALTQIPGSLAAGRLVDYFGSRPVLLCHPIPMIIGALALALSPSWWAVWLFMAGTALTSSTNTLLRTTLMMELFGAARVGEARGRLSILFTIGNALSPVILGLAFGAGASPAAMLAVSALALALSVVPAVRHLRKSEVGFRDKDPTAPLNQI